MASRPANVRYVKCPKCMLVLPESGKHLVYKCGGCGALLQSKYPDGNRESEASEPHQNIVGEHNSEDNDSIAGSKQAEILSSSHEDVSDLDQGRVGTVSGDHITSSSEGTRNSSRISSSGEIDCYRKEGLSKFGKSKGQSYGNDEVRASNSSPGYNDTFTRRHSKIAIQGELPQNVQCKTENSLLDGKVDLVESSADQFPKHVRMRDEMEVNTNTVVSDSLDDTKFNGEECFLKSAATRSSRVYYGSVSSNEDDYDDRGPTRSQNLPLSKRTVFRTQRAADSLSTEKKSPRKEEFLMNGEMSTDSVVHPPLEKLTSQSSYEKYASALSRTSTWNQDEQLESNGYGYQSYRQKHLQDKEVFNSVESWMHSERETPAQFPSRDLQRGRYSSTLHQNGGPSNYGQEKLEYLDHDRIEFFRKVERLRDQYSKLSGERAKLKETFPLSSLEKELLPSHNAAHPQHPLGGYGPTRSAGSQQSRSSQMHFSGSTNCRHHIDYSCLECFPEEWQCPAQFPPSSCYNKGRCLGCPTRMCHLSCSPSLPSSQLHLDHSFPLHFHNTSALPRDHRLMDHEMGKLYYKEKRHSSKRHCRPIAGGAPFIMCYNCWKLLQVPADFLLTKRGRHKLRCGACSEVLMFSLHGETHIIPFSPSHIQHPPSEVDQFSCNDSAIRNMPSASCVNDYPQVDPISCSDDYGNSACISYSTESEPPLVAAPFPSVESGMRDKMHASSSSLDWKGERKNLEPNHSINKSKVSRQGHKSVVLLVGVNESESSAPRAGSPLHRLMGYSSPTEMINASTDEDNQLDSAGLQIGETFYPTSK